MSTETGTPYVTSEDLPPYRAVLAVDAKDFTKTPGRLHQSISGLIPRLVGNAFTRIDQARLWDEPAFFGPTGDGFAVGLPTHVLPYLIHPLLPELQRVLGDYNNERRASEPLIRLRASLNVGPVKEHENPYLGGNGVARNDTHRLLDSKPVRAILAAASPQVTFLAAIVSDRVYGDVVEQGYAGLHPDHFIEVPAVVDGKQFQQRAWLYLPQPSGNLLGIPDLTPPPAPDRPERSDSGGAREQSGVHIGTNSGLLSTGTNHGGMHQHLGERR
ncbi:hypothetical protein Aph02nite_76530 [Actinoplanes philippinensis]|uniref:Guanylate cyclase domain-containing protein n=1 Tax=Actinoplanes philippinensis TaxID=35752 RepID=A0A1I2HCU7_9ACTN|nr:hypothetical protein [Actinoplanes philippinensis]GIE81703.1 hypothetical protein Aph02nite_76530 [Actinoplanes philippinensis]SFF28004.1 hypothetical protein SAMN05421541_10893 [Actinoplanes philippinensis]